MCCQASATLVHVGPGYVCDESDKLAFDFAGCDVMQTCNPKGAVEEPDL